MFELPEFIQQAGLLLTAVIPGLPALVKTCLWFCAECACQAGHCMSPAADLIGTSAALTSTSGSGYTPSEFRDEVFTGLAVDAGISATGGPSVIAAPLTAGPTAIKGYRAVQKSGGVMGGGGAEELGRPTAAQEIRWMYGF